MSSSSTAAEAMVVVVDVVDAANATTADTPRGHTDGLIERLEIDVEVTAHTTADDLLVDVEAALLDMECSLCVPRSAAALAAGRVLPPVAAVELALRLSLSSANGVGSGKVTASYASAVRHAMGSHPFPRDALCLGNERLLSSAPSFENKAEKNSGLVCWSVIPRSIEGPEEVGVNILVSSNTIHSAASAHMLARDEATRPPSGAAVRAETRGNDDGEGTVQNGPGPGDSVAGAAAEKNVKLSNHYPIDASDGQRNTQGNSNTIGAEMSTTVPPRSVTTVSSSSPTSVVALEDVDVVAFRRLQAHRSLVLARAEAAGCAVPPGAGDSGDVLAEEYQRLQPTLPWAAVETAIQAEVRRLQAERVLTSWYAGGAASMKVHPSSSPLSLNATRAHLRAAWLRAMRDETAAYQTAVPELRLATERAEVWRSALKDALRGEIAELEREAAQRATATTERDVLQRRVGQLEAQVAAAKAAERALLQAPRASSDRATDSNGKMKADGASPSPEKFTGAQRQASVGTSEKEGATAVAATSPAAALSTSAPSSSKASRRRLQSPPPPSSSCSSSSSLSSNTSGDSDAPPPPPPQSLIATTTHVPAQTINGGSVCPAQTLKDSQTHQRWSGRRVPLTHSNTAAPPSSTAAFPPRSRSRRLSIERSFLSQSLQEEVRAALASDLDDSVATSSTSVLDRGESGRRSSSSSSSSKGNAVVHVARQPQHTVKAAPPPSSPSERTQSASRRRRYQRKEDFADGDPRDAEASTFAPSTEQHGRSGHRPPFPASVTPIRTAPTTASSPSPIIPAMYRVLGRRSNRYDNDAEATAAGAGAAAPSLPLRRDSSTSVPAPPFAKLYDGEERNRLLASKPAQRPGAAEATSAVEELRTVTSALRRHIREPQPDPVEGQRLLQQVRELRREMERESEEQSHLKGHEEEERGADRQQGRGGRDVRGGGGGVTFVDPRESVAAAAPSRVTERNSFSSSSLLYDSRVPSRRAGTNRY